MLSIATQGVHALNEYLQQLLTGSMRRVLQGDTPEVLGARTGSKCYVVYSVPAAVYLRHLGMCNTGVAHGIYPSNPGVCIGMGAHIARTCRVLG